MTIDYFIYLMIVVTSIITCPLYYLFIHYLNQKLNQELNLILKLFSNVFQLWTVVFNSFFTNPITNNSDISFLHGTTFPFTGGSPFTLAPAVPVQSNTSPPTTTVNSTPLKPNEKVINPASSLFSSLPSNKELLSKPKDPEVLSTVPLDSPPHNETKSVMENFLQPVSTGNNSIGPKPGSRQGWNDPPFLSSFSSPGPQRSKTQPPMSSSSISPLPREDPVVGVSRSDPSLEINSSSFDQYQIQPLVTQTTR